MAEAKQCIECGSTKVHGRRRCFEHWVALGIAECRAAKRKKPDRRVMLFREAREARMNGDTARHRFIIANRALPEETLAHGRTPTSRALRNQVAERTFVSDIVLDDGCDDWHGYEYFGDVSRENWPELERLGLGGRDTSRVRKKRL